MAVEGNRVHLSYAGLRTWALAYAGLPLLIFLLTWVRPALGLPLAALLVLGWARASGLHQRGRGGGPSEESHLSRSLDLKRGDCVVPDAPASKELCIGIGTLGFLVCAVVVWCFLGGQGGMWYQSNDWAARNAIYRDLITHPWPVYYREGYAAMSYYVGHWLPPALLANFLGSLGMPADLLWHVANHLLLLWTATGMAVVVLLALVTLGVDDRPSVALVLLMLVFFATPDVIGLTLSHRWDIALQKLHLEQWAQAQHVAVGQYSSITTCLFWVFNQAVVPWICTLCFLNERSFSNYLFIWLCALFVGPLPSVGLAFLMLGQGVAVLVESKGRQARIRALRSVLTFQNLAPLACLLVIGAFFLVNNAVGSDSSSTIAGDLAPGPLWLPTNLKVLKYLATFVVLEGLILPALLWLSGLRRSWLLGMVAASLVLCPFVRIGYGIDFSMRASIPAILCLCVLCMRRILSWRAQGRPRQAWVYALMVVLALGAATPTMEFYRGFHDVAIKGVEASIPDAGSIDSKGLDLDRTNFAVKNPQDTVFFHYLARDRR